MNDDSSKSDGESDWNAYTVAPMLISCGVGVVFGALFAMGKANYVGLIVAGVGLCIAMAGLALSFSLGRGNEVRRRDEAE